MSSVGGLEVGYGRWELRRRVGGFVEEGWRAVGTFHKRTALDLGAVEQHAGTRCLCWRSGSCRAVRYSTVVLCKLLLLLG